MELRVPIEIHKKDNWYVASCPVLDVVSQGKNESSAKRNLGEALELFLTTCFEMGTLDDVLKTCGFELFPDRRRKERVPKIHQEDYVDIPLYLLANKNGMDRCHA